LQTAHFIRVDVFFAKTKKWEDTDTVVSGRYVMLLLVTKWHRHWRFTALRE